MNDALPSGAPSGALASIDAVISLAEIYENIELVAPDGIEEASPYPPRVEVPRLHGS